MKIRGIPLACAVPIAAGAVVLGSSAPAPGASARTVVLKDISFKPAKLVVPRNTTVTFAWRDGDTPHDLRSKGRPRFKGTGTRTRGTHRVRFTKAGTYRYVCTIHPGMAGRVVVR